MSLLEEVCEFPRAPLRRTARVTATGEWDVENLADVGAAKRAIIAAGLLVS